MKKEQVIYDGIVKMLHFYELDKLTLDVDTEEWAAKDWSAKEIRDYLSDKEECLSHLAHIRKHIEELVYVTEKWAHLPD